MIKLTAALLVAFVFLIAFIFFELSGKNAAISCLAGGAIMLFNLGGFYFAWRFYFLKKSIALTVGVIIFKYVLLGLVFWSLTKASWIHPVGFITGISTLVLAALSMTVVKSFARKL